MSAMSVTAASAGFGRNHAGRKPAGHGDLDLLAVLYSPDELRCILAEFTKAHGA